MPDIDDTIKMFNRSIAIKTLNECWETCQYRNKLCSISNWPLKNMEITETLFCVSYSLISISE